MGLHEEVIGAVWRSKQLASDLDALCAFGGRLAGSQSELEARDYLRKRLAEIPDVALSEHRYSYEGWERTLSRLTLLGANGPRERACHSLLWSPDTPPGGLEAEVVDVGRGTAEAFDALAPRIKGRIVLVRHEYPFAAGTIHRMKKYIWARDRGAAGFLIANCIPGEMVVTGFAGANGPTDIPAAGVSLETGAMIAAQGENGRVRLEIKGTRRPAEGASLIGEVPGQGKEWVVLSAHYDGHDLGQSALDNGTGAVAVLTILAALAPHVGKLPRGLRAMLFTTEEWGLHGSRLYVDGLAEEERRRIAVNVNLDTIAGGPRLACLTSTFPELVDFAQGIERRTGISLDIVTDLRRNSDHYNFARRGIPAMRLVSGFDRVDSEVRHLLMASDTRDKVHDSELKYGACVAAEFVWTALTRTGAIAKHKTADDLAPILRRTE